MKKLFPALLLILFCATYAQGQTVSVTGTITDANSQIYASGGWSAVMISQSGGSGPFYYQGQQLSTAQTAMSGSLDSSGAFSATMYSNALVTPNGTLWRFTFTPASSSPSYSQSVFIFGTSQSISSTITPPAIVVQAGPFTTAYADSEVTGFKEGTVYWNITSGTLRAYHSGAWQTAGGGGGGSGTVTEVDTTGPITGGPITTTGTVGCATCGVTGSPLSQFAATTSLQLAGVISDETGSGSLVFGTSPTLVTPALGTPSAIVLTNATGLPASSLTGQVSVPNGGTGLGTLTSNAVYKGNGTGNIALTSITDNGTTVATTEPISAGSSVSTAANGTNPSAVTFVGNTANPAQIANVFQLFGPASATFAGLSIQMPSSPITTGHVITATTTGQNMVLTDGGAPGSGSVGGTATVGFLPKMVTNTSTIGASLCDEGITTANTLTCTDTAGITAPLFHSSGAGAGGLVMTAGTAQGHATASTITEEAPATVATPWEYVWPAAAATGVLEYTNTSNVVAGSIVATTGTGSVVQANTPTLVTPAIGAATGTSLSVTGSLTSTVATGTAPVVVTSTTTVPNLTLSNHPKEYFCGTTSTCSATAELSPKIVFGSAPLVTGTPSTVTISGISPAFTATADYQCTISGPGSTAATNLYGWAAVSSSSFTITGPATVTTVVSYLCVGF